ncbi:unnamed protein product [Paramecium sonneborni]|uniref:Uncharacterized protein n=1 Tax=Paramecium sonneborni TaxID=65129 RepID=A0A8S1QZ29_9CILI|nr:unnamed protein product [Paramecium sonneborni]
MNTLSSNPKKTMFYAAAQNMLNQHSSHSSVQNLQRSLFQLALVPPSINQKEQLNQSLNNYSDRVQQNLSLPKNNNIYLQDRDRSLSYKLNNSIELNKSFERLQNAYNIKAKFLTPNQNPNLILEKEIKKQELKAYLLKQIQEKQIQSQQEQERIKIEELKAEQLVKRQLEEIRVRQNSKFEIPPQPINQGTFCLIYYYIRKICNYQINTKMFLNHQYPHKKMAFFCKFITLNQTTIINKMISFKSQVAFKNNIKKMIRKSSQLLPQSNDQIQEHKINQINDRQLECNTIFIPANSKLDLYIDTQQQQSSQQEVSKSTHNFIQNNSFQQLQQQNISTISNPINNSQHYSSQNPNINSVINHSRLTISQLTSRERSISNEKQNEELLAKVDEIKDEIKGFTQKVKKSVQPNLQLKLPHRTTMLMQISSKNSNQVSKQEEPKSSQRN